MSSPSYSTIAQAQTIADTPGSWTQSADFNQFDPSLGTLLNLDVGVIGDVTGSVAIENLEAAPAVFSLGLASPIAVYGPAGSTLAGTELVGVEPAVGATTTLAAFDGTLDYGGLSGAVLGDLSNTATQEAMLQPGTSGTDPFVGTGTVALPVTASTFLQVAGPANMQVLSHASAGATVSLDYNYGTPAGTVSDDGAGGSVFITEIASAPIGYAPAPKDLLTTSVQTLSVADSTTGWTTIVAAAQFDPALGTLEAVNVTLSNDIAASVEAVNLDPTTAVLSTGQTATVTLDLVGTAQTLSTDATVSTATTLAASDGSTAFSGPSAVIDQGLTASAHAGSLSDEGAFNVATVTEDLAAYTGTGAIDLPIVSSSTGSILGPGNLLAQLLAQGGATVTVSYTYQPVPIVADAGDTVSYAPGGTVAADPGISLGDAGTSTLTWAAVAITGGLQPGDVLSVANTAWSGIDSNFVDGMLTLSGTASLAAYQALLQSLTFSSSAADPTAGGSDIARTLTWTVGDNYGAASAPVTSTIDVAMPAPVALFKPIVPAVTPMPLLTVQPVVGGTFDPLMPVALTPVMLTGSEIRTFRPILPVGTVTPGLASKPVTPSYPHAVTAATLGLDPAQLAAASGASAGAPDVWQIMTQTDISNTGSVLDLLLNPADQRWVALTTPQGSALGSGELLAGGPMAALGQFLSNEHQGG